MKSTTLVQTFNNLRFGHGLAPEWELAAPNRKRKLSATKGPKLPGEPRWTEMRGAAVGAGRQRSDVGKQSGQSLPKLQPKYPMGCLIKVSPRGYPFTSTLAATLASTTIPSYKYSSIHRQKLYNLI